MKQQNNNKSGKIPIPQKPCYTNCRFTNDESTSYHHLVLHTFTNPV